MSDKRTGKKAKSARPATNVSAGIVGETPAVAADVPRRLAMKKKRK